MDGVGGRPGWAWIFILEGSFTILASGLSLWVIQDFPESATFLTETERMWEKKTALHSHEPYADRHIRRCVRHPQVTG
jgi:CHASE3 domain sensor protein